MINQQKTYQQVETIEMVNLKSQYLKIKDEIDDAIQEVIDKTQFIKGEAVTSFEKNLAAYLKVKHVISCGNGTDALQIALMSLNLKSGDEVIVPAFTYVATIEVISLLGLTPVLIDVDPNTFNITVDNFAKAITDKTKAIIPVHLFGQSTDMDDVVRLARDHSIFIIEDNAQSIGAQFTYVDGRKAMTGTIGEIGTTSFFPTKNLGCFGDGGAIFTNNSELAVKIRMIANHGQSKKYQHELIGCNSRLDSIQAAILNVKLKYLEDYANARKQVGDRYDEAFSKIKNIKTPERSSKSTHVFNQYTLKVKDRRRDALAFYLKEKGISTGIYYPLPMYKQEAFLDIVPSNMFLENTEMLCKQVISLPIHTEMKASDQTYIIECVKDFFYRA